jgi:hypothetical protein
MAVLEGRLKSRDHAIAAAVGAQAPQNDKGHDGCRGLGGGLCSWAQLFGTAQTIPLNMVVERGVAGRGLKAGGSSTWWLAP